MNVAAMNAAAMMRQGTRRDTSDAVRVAADADRFHAAAVDGTRRAVPGSGSFHDDPSSRRA